MPSIAHARSTVTVAALVAVSVIGAGCAPATAGRIPPAPIASLWPDPTYEPERQCQGAYGPEELQGYLSRARLALVLPDTRAVTLDNEARCINIVVDGVGAGRLAELVMRGVSVPRGAVLLLLATPVQRS
jgi:hypothetical protein